jgi:hypothetical protein
MSYDVYFREVSVKVVISKIDGNNLRIFLEAS